MNKPYEVHIEEIAKSLNKEIYEIRYGIDRLIDDYREEIIENYTIGAGFDGFETYAGCKVGWIGEADGYVVITKSRAQAVKAIKAMEKDTSMEDVEVDEDDLIEGSLWTYKRPEESGTDQEFYYDFASKHPNAKKCFYYYI